MRATVNFESKDHSFIHLDSLGSSVFDKKFETLKKEVEKNKNSYIADWQVEYPENQPDSNKPVPTIDFYPLW